MGISVSILMVSDDQIARFQAHIGELEHLLTTTIPYFNKNKCYLSDYWGGLHYLLTKGESGRIPLVAALEKGDVQYTGASDPTHALFSSSTKDLAAAMAVLSEEALRERYDIENMRHLSVYPGRYWVFPEYAEETFQELMMYFKRLRNTVTEAAEKDMGLIICRYEDW